MPTQTGSKSDIPTETTPLSTKIPCRTCTDFKTWAKQQRQAMTTVSTSETSSEATSKIQEAVERKAKQCPFDKDELGQSTWGLMHTIAAHYPDKPTQQEASDVTSFFHGLSKVYPCDWCAKDFRNELKIEPVEAQSQTALSQWLCRLHNKVNVKLGKTEFDCSKVNQRWRDGWLDGSCDS